MKGRRNRWWLVSIALVLLGLLLGSCVPAAAPTPAPTPKPGVAPPTPTSLPAPTPKPAVAQPIYGGTLTIAQGGDPPSLDPHQEAAGTSGWAIMPNYSRLVQYSPLDPIWREMVPDLAERWEVSADGLAYTFYLRKGVKWHDGQPFTSQDAKYSLDRIRLQPKGMASLRKEEMAGIDRIETPDDSTMKVHLKYASASFLPLLATPWYMMVPQHVLEKEGQAALKGKVVGTGPFTLKEWIRGVSYESVKYPDYFVPGRPYLDGYKLYIIKDYGARLSALRTHQIQYIPAVPGISPREAEVAKRELGDKIVVVKGATAAVRGITFNTQRKPFDDARVRRAISLAIDREAYLQAVEQGVGLVSGWFYPKGQWALPSEEMAQLPGYGPDMTARIAETKRLLVEAGYPGGFETSMVARADIASYARNAEFVNFSLAPLGIKVKVVIMEPGAFYAAQLAQGLDLTAFSVAISLDDPDPLLGTFVITGAGRPYAGYSNPEVDKLYAEQTRLLDFQERKKVVDRLHRLVLQEVPYAIYGWPEYILVTWAEVKNIQHPAGMMSHIASNLREVWIAK